MRPMPQHICALLALALVACAPRTAPQPEPAEQSSGGEAPARMGAMVAPGTSSSALGKLEGGAHAAGETGVETLAVRRDADTAFTGVADGDHAPLQVNSTGALKVSGTISSGTVTAAGAAAHDAPVSGNPTRVAGYASAAAPSDVSGDGDTVNAWHLRNGSQAVTVTAAGALIGGDATYGLKNDVTRTPVPTASYYGQTTVATSGTEVTLGASQALTQGCWVKALSANTGFMYVGNNPVTTSTGYQLDALEAVFVPISNRTTIYVDSSVNGDGVSYLCF